MTWTVTGFCQGGGDEDANMTDRMEIGERLGMGVGARKKRWEMGHAD